jgi:hypothetical protein
LLAGGAPIAKRALEPGNLARRVTVARRPARSSVAWIAAITAIAAPPLIIVHAHLAGGDIDADEQVEFVDVPPASARTAGTAFAPVPALPAQPFGLFIVTVPAILTVSPITAGSPFGTRLAPSASQGDREDAVDCLRDGKADP